MIKVWGGTRRKRWEWVVIRSRDLEPWRIQRKNEEEQRGLDGDKELGVKPIWSLRKLDSS